MTGSDPFDFSEFGGRSPAPPAGPTVQSGRPDSGSQPASQPGHYPTSGFDPFAGQPPAGHPAGEELFGGSAGPDSLAVAGPPLSLFALASGVAVLGAALGLTVVVIDGAVPLAFLGWLLAGPAAIGVLAWFSGVDTRRRLAAVYSSPTWLSSGYWVVVVVCVLGIAASAWRIALWASRF